MGVTRTAAKPHPRRRAFKGVGPQNRGLERPGHPRQATGGFPQTVASGPEPTLRQDTDIPAQRRAVIHTRGLRPPGNSHYGTAPTFQRGRWALSTAGPPALELEAMARHPPCPRRWWRPPAPDPPYGKAPTFLRRQRAVIHIPWPPAPSNHATARHRHSCGDGARLSTPGGIRPPGIHATATHRQSRPASGWLSTGEPVVHNPRPSDRFCRCLPVAWFEGAGGHARPSATNATRPNRIGNGGPRPDRADLSEVVDNRAPEPQALYG